MKLASNIHVIRGKEGFDRAKVEKNAIVVLTLVIVGRECQMVWIAVEGDTYEARHLMKKLGLRWDRAYKAWVFSDYTSKKGLDKYDGDDRKMLETLWRDKLFEWISMSFKVANEVALEFPRKKIYYSLEVKLP